MALARTGVVRLAGLSGAAALALGAYGALRDPTGLLNVSKEGVTEEQRKAFEVSKEGVTEEHVTEEDGLRGR